MSAEREAAIRARLAAATPGPWERTVDDHGRKGIDVGVWALGAARYAVETLVVGNPNHMADAELIANAPADIAYLLALVDRQRAALDAVRELADEWALNGEVQVDLISAALAAADDGGTRGRRSAARPGDRLSGACDGDQGGLTERLLHESTLLAAAADAGEGPALPRGEGDWLDGACDALEFVRNFRSGDAL